MNKLPPQSWQHDGTTFVVSLFVQGGVVVGMTPVTTDAGIVVPQPDRKLLGDRIAGITSAMGVKPCGGCNKRKEVLNGWHKKVTNLLA